jgi:predicted ATP-binding protein involved in virulence
MRLHRLELHNFKGFEQQTFEFPCQFNLLVGNNGSGKTNVLDAAAVALGIWLVEPPDKKLVTSRRSIFEKEIRLWPEPVGDRVQFQPCHPVFVKAIGQIADKKDVQWTSAIKEAGKNVTRPDSQTALSTIRKVFASNSNGNRTICPVIAYYGAGRAWLPSKQIGKKSQESHEPARRWKAFHDCLSERIRFQDLVDWFRSETIASANRGGRMRPGFEAVKRAILQCVPEADGAWYDDDQKDIILSLGGQAQPMKNLSAGQRMMLAVVGDLAIRCITQNAHLLPADELGPEDNPLPRVLKETPGVALIDELDVHLHPKWQRRVATDLKRTFPLIQFICTSHSPQVIGEVMPEELQFLKNGVASRNCGQSFGMDSNWILSVLMDADPMDEGVERRLDEIKTLLVEGNIDQATAILNELRGEVGNSGAIQRAASSIERFKYLHK